MAPKKKSKKGLSDTERKKVLQKSVFRIGSTATATTAAAVATVATTRGGTKNELQCASSIDAKEWSPVKINDVVIIDGPKIGAKSKKHTMYLGVIKSIHCVPRDHQRWTAKLTVIPWYFGSQHQSRVEPGTEWRLTNPKPKKKGGMKAKRSPPLEITMDDLYGRAAITMSMFEEGAFPSPWDTFSKEPSILTGQPMKHHPNFFITGSTSTLFTPKDYTTYQKQKKNRHAIVKRLCPYITMPKTSTELIRKSEQVPALEMHRTTHHHVTEYLQKMKDCFDPLNLEYQHLHKMMWEDSGDSTVARAGERSKATHQQLLKELTTVSHELKSAATIYMVFLGHQKTGKSFMANTLLLDGMTANDLKGTTYKHVWLKDSKLGQIPLPNGGHSDNTKGIVECQYGDQVQLIIQWNSHAEYTKLVAIGFDDIHCNPDFTPQWIGSRSSGSVTSTGVWESESLVFDGRDSVLESDLLRVVDELRMMNSGLKTLEPLDDDEIMRRNSVTYAINKMIIRGPFAFLNPKLRSQNRTSYLTDLPGVGEGHVFMLKTIEYLQLHRDQLLVFHSVSGRGYTRTPNNIDPLYHVDLLQSNDQDELARIIPVVNMYYSKLSAFEAAEFENKLSVFAKQIQLELRRDISKTLQQKAVQFRFPTSLVSYLRGMWQQPDSILVFPAKDQGVVDDYRPTFGQRVQMLARSEVSHFLRRGTNDADEVAIELLSWLQIGTVYALNTGGVATYVKNVRDRLRELNDTEGTMMMTALNSVKVQELIKTTLMDQVRIAQDSLVTQSAPRRKLDQQTQTSTPQGIRLHWAHLLSKQWEEVIKSTLASVRTYCENQFNKLLDAAIESADKNNAKEDSKSIDSVKASTMKTFKESTRASLGKLRLGGLRIAAERTAMKFPGVSDFDAALAAVPYPGHATAAGVGTKEMKRSSSNMSAYAVGGPVLSSGNLDLQEYLKRISGAAIHVLQQSFGNLVGDDDSSVDHDEKKQVTTISGGLIGCPAPLLFIRDHVVNQIIFTKKQLGKFMIGPRVSKILGQVNGDANDARAKTLQQTIQQLKEHRHYEVQQYRKHFRMDIPLYDVNFPRYPNMNTSTLRISMNPEPTPTAIVEDNKSKEKIQSKFIRPTPVPYEIRYDDGRSFTSLVMLGQMKHGDRFLIEYGKDKGKDKQEATLTVAADGAATISFTSTIDGRTIACDNWTDLKTKVFDEIVHALIDEDIHHARAAFITSIKQLKSGSDAKSAIAVDTSSRVSSVERTITITINDARDGIIINVPTNIRQVVDAHILMMKSREKPFTKPGESGYQVASISGAPTAISSVDGKAESSVNLEPVFIPSYARAKIANILLSASRDDSTAADATKQADDDIFTPKLVFCVIDHNQLATYDAQWKTKDNSLFFIRLPQNNRGIGVARSFINIVADALGFTSHFVLDDDVKGLKQWVSAMQIRQQSTILRGALWASQLFQVVQEEQGKLEVSSQQLPKDDEIDDTIKDVFTRCLRGTKESSLWVKYIWNMILAEISANDSFTLLKRVVERSDFVIPSIATSLPAAATQDSGDDTDDAMDQSEDGKSAKKKSSICSAMVDKWQWALVHLWQPIVRVKYAPLYERQQAHQLVVSTISLAGTRIYANDATPENMDKFWRPSHNHKAFVLYDTRLVRGFLFGITHDVLLDTNRDAMTSRDDVVSFISARRPDRKSKAENKRLIKEVHDRGFAHEDISHCTTLRDNGLIGLRVHGFSVMHFKWAIKKNPDHGGIAAQGGRDIYDFFENGTKKKKKNTATTPATAAAAAAAATIESPKISPLTPPASAAALLSPKAKAAAKKKGKQIKADKPKKGKAAVPSSPSLSSSSSAAVAQPVELQRIQSDASADGDENEEENDDDDEDLESFDPSRSWTLIENSTQLLPIDSTSFDSSQGSPSSPTAATAATAAAAAAPSTWALRECGAGGDCGPKVASYYLFGSCDQSHANAIRELIAVCYLNDDQLKQALDQDPLISTGSTLENWKLQRMKTFNDELRDPGRRLENNDWKSFVTRIATPGIWWDEAEWRILGALFGIEIRIYSSRRDAQEIKSSQHALAFGKDRLCAPYNGNPSTIGQMTQPLRFPSEPLMVGNADNWHFKIIGRGIRGRFGSLAINEPLSFMPHSRWDHQAGGGARVRRLSSSTAAAVSLPSATSVEQWDRLQSICGISRDYAIASFYSDFYYVPADDELVNFVEYSSEFSRYWQFVANYKVDHDDAKGSPSTETKSILSSSSSRANPVPMTSLSSPSSSSSSSSSAAAAAASSSSLHKKRTRPDMISTLPAHDNDDDTDDDIVAMTPLSQVPAPVAAAPVVVSSSSSSKQVTKKARKSASKKK